MRTWAVGDRIHGFANGVFGRDSYTCRTVEQVTRDYIVTRSDSNEVEICMMLNTECIVDPDDRSYCAAQCCGWKDEDGDS